MSNSFIDFRFDYKASYKCYRIIRCVKKRRLRVGLEALTYFYRLYGLLLNTFLHLITIFSAYNWLTAEKKRVSGLVMSQRKVGKRKVRELSELQPYEEQFSEMNLYLRTLVAPCFNRKCLIRRFSCFIIMELTNGLTRFQRIFVGDNLRPAQHSGTMCTCSSPLEFDITARLRRSASI